MTLDSRPMTASAVRREGDLSVEAARCALARRSALIGRDLIFLKSTDSTNTCAARLAAKGTTEGAVVVADHQTGGRGRLGRTWFSPPARNLYLSVIVRPLLPVTEAALLTLVAAVACTRALRRATPVPVSIKWPNDLVAGDRKLGGILTEFSVRHEAVSYAVIGIGLNVNMTIAEAPYEIRALVTSLREATGTPVNRTCLLVELLAELDAWYRLFSSGGKAPVLAEWIRLTTTIDRTVLVTTPSGMLKGKAEGIDSSGRLMLRDPDGSMTAVSSGDVTILAQP